MKKLNLNKIVLSLPILCNIALFVIITILLLCSCQNTSRSTEIKTVDDSILDNSDFNNPKVNEFIYKNHEYVKFRWGTGHQTNTGVIHNPDCKFCKNDTIKY